jgi:uncharacterized protein (TIGR02996 family)
MSNDRYTAWIADQIAQHEPGDDRNAMMRLAEATAALSTGAGMVFGMMMPPELQRRDELSTKAIEMLKLWVPRLDEGATEQLADVVTRARLPIDLAERRAEHERLRRVRIEERIAKSTALDARFTELERSIVENPDDRDAWLVLADFQQSKGDPRGELIALSIAGETDQEKRRKADEWLAAHRDVLLGPLAEHDGWTWHRGYIDSAFLSYPDESGAASRMLELLLQHPSGRFLRDLSIGFDGSTEDTLENVTMVLAEHTVPTLRALYLGSFEYPEQCEMSWFNVGDLSLLWRALPRLTKLTVQGNMTLGEIAHDKLEHLELFTGGLPAESARSVSAANLPALRHLEVWYGSESYGGNASIFDVAPLLARHDLPALRHLGLKNCEFTDEICDGIARSRLLRQLATLDLSMGTMSDDGADALVQHAAAFKHLKSIDVSASFLTSDGIARLQKLGPEIIDGGQRTGERYVVVGE